MELWEPSMSVSEQHMKNYIESHPDIKGRILTADELSEFIVRMLKAHSPEFHEELTEYYYGEIPDNVQSIMQASRAAGEETETDRLQRHLSLSDFFRRQSESGYIRPEFDVSVMRVFRYMPVHWHANEYFTVCYCISGTCPILFSNETVDMTAGNILILAPDTLYASPCYQDDSILIYYEIRKSTFYEVFWRNLSDVSLLSNFFTAALSGDNGTPYLLFPIHTDPEIHQLLYRAYCEATTPREYANHFLVNTMSLALLTLLRRYAASVVVSQDSRLHLKPEYMQILNYIQANYVYVTMGELEDVFHYSSRQLDRIIQECTGKSFSVLRRELRIKRAALLLSRTSMSVNEVSAAVGYNDMTAFCRTFSKTLGLSPIKWRKQSQE